MFFHRIFIVFNICAAPVRCNSGFLQAVFYCCLCADSEMISGIVETVCLFENFPDFKVPYSCGRVTLGHDPSPLTRYRNHTSTLTRSGMLREGEMRDSVGLSCLGSVAPHPARTCGAVASCSPSSPAVGCGGSAMNCAAASVAKRPPFSTRDSKEPLSTISP